MSTHTEAAKAAEDLQFVRDALQRKGVDKAEYTITVVWAVVNLVGLSLYDFSVVAGGIFWIIALPVFGIGTGMWAAKQQAKSGEINRELGRRNGQHWTAIPIFLVLCNAVLIAQGQFDGRLAGQLVLLVVGLVYYLGGVHFWRPYMYGGIALASGVVWLAFLDRFPWTLTGVLTFSALMISATYDWRRRVVAQ